MKKAVKICVKILLILILLVMAGLGVLTAMEYRPAERETVRGSSDRLNSAAYRPAPFCRGATHTLSSSVVHSGWAQ